MNIQRDTEYRYGEFVQNPEYKDIKIHYTYIDLGLPSGTLWATCNVGAKNPWESGKYYMWGDLVGFTADDVPGNSKPSTEILQKYTNNFNYILDLEDDVAHAECGSKAHIPSKSLFDELNDYNLTTKTTINNYEGSGVKVLKITSKINGNYIIIPYAGYLFTTGLSSYNLYYYLRTNEKSYPIADSDEDNPRFYTPFFGTSGVSGASSCEIPYNVRAVKDGDGKISKNDVHILMYNGDTSTWDRYDSNSWCGLLNRSGNDSYINSMYSEYGYGYETENEFFLESLGIYSLAEIKSMDKAIVYGSADVAHSHEPIVLTCRHYNEDYTSYTTETFTIPWKENSGTDNVEIYDFEHIQPLLPPLDEEQTQPDDASYYKIEKVQIGNCGVWYRWGGPEGGGD